jgi:hypothetical protein
MKTKTNKRNAPLPVGSGDLLDHTGEFVLQSTRYRDGRCGETVVLTAIKGKHITLTKQDARELTELLHQAFRDSSAK